jgi:hypothetical protein
MTDQRLLNFHYRMPKRTEREDRPYFDVSRIVENNGHVLNQNVFWRIVNNVSRFPCEWAVLVEYLVMNSKKVFIQPILNFADNDILFRNANDDLVLYDKESGSTLLLISNNSQVCGFIFIIIVQGSVRGIRIGK